MPLVRYFTHKNNPDVMLPTRRHFVDEHGTIHRPQGVLEKLNKKGRRAWREGLRENSAKQGE